MIVGVGVDLVDIARFEDSLERTPSLRERLFTEAERALPVRSLAARFAAKEALAKALGAPAGLAWHDAEVRAYVLGRAAVRERYGDGSDVVRAVDGLSYWIRGPIDWSCESGRYAEAST